MGYPFFPEPPPPPDRAGFGLDEEDFLFLFNFDFHSVVERKNPEGLISAFRKAFSEGRTRARLVLKSINSHRHPERAAALKQLASGLNIVWVDEHLDGARMKTLFATTDCYISLHRSEGLGLGMARAMSYGKPVIATGYSGNLDFTTPENSLLVSFALTELPQDYGVYEKGNFWAEPDTDHAAALMRQVFENPEEARQMGLRGQADLARTMDPQSVLERITQRLGEIDPRLRAG
jgi:glycosyltransferase involved in cell wall biosynthesis